MFQSTRPCGARLKKKCKKSFFFCVSIHAPLRGATIVLDLLLAHRYSFNPRAPAGRDGADPPLDPLIYQFQSTRPCGARLTRLTLETMIAMVSIHAPLRGATIFPSTTSCFLPVSIHAPLRGATQYDFSPLAKLWVSIHAPLRGATRCTQGSHIGRRVSIHAPLRGATMLSGSR